ncbi:ribbon-helix-helix protein, CopG family [Corticibacterium sp. UT-5YL-CI-8]|nr:ribbon-helix-helix protein, CopG family [Tianweitania sp. UT-5YL-CI-8]
MPSSAKTSLTLDPTTTDRVEKLASSRHRSPQVLMREAIEQYVEREEMRDAFHQQGRDAWNEYQATGLHLTGEEADQWLARLEADEDIDVPQCHN